MSAKIPFEKWLCRKVNVSKEGKPANAFMVKYHPTEKNDFYVKVAHERTINITAEHAKVLNHGLPGVNEYFSFYLKPGADTPEL